jgi:hypothetical protein
LIRYIGKEIVYNVLEGKYNASILRFNENTNTYYVMVKEINVIYPFKIEK